MLMLEYVSNSLEQERRSGRLDELSVQFPRLGAQNMQAQKVPPPVRLPFPSCPEYEHDPAQLNKAARDVFFFSSEVFRLEKESLP